jgi:hypothetical protein
MGGVIFKKVNQKSLVKNRFELGLRKQFHLIDFLYPAVSASEIEAKHSSGLVLL